MPTKKRMPEKEWVKQKLKPKMLARPRAMLNVNWVIASSTWRLANAWVWIMALVRTNILIPKWDPKEKAEIVVEDGQTPETQLANLVKTIVELLQPMVVLVEIVRRVPEKTEKLTGYVDASVTVSTLRTKHAKTRWVVLQMERKIARPAMLGSKVIVRMELHAEIGTLRIVVGILKENALLVKIAYSCIETILGVL